MTARHRGSQPDREPFDLAALGGWAFILLVLVATCVAAAAFVRALI